MKEVIIANKKKYFKDNYPFDDAPKLTDKKHCIHCDLLITVDDYNVFKDRDGELIYCPNAPKCDGTVMDWFDLDEQTQELADGLDALQEKYKHRVKDRLFNYFDVNVFEREIYWKTDKKLPPEIELEIDTLIKQVY